MDPGGVTYGGGGLSGTRVVARLFERPASWLHAADAVARPVPRLLLPAVDSVSEQTEDRPTSNLSKFERSRSDNSS
ncbi:hypothetical protein K0M31_005974 [Melipona bicolor]|uniref:Uncharacterized protein n=1 Tax=Melipona bicolor TaxID=60889 RepID=A0AA40KLA4_9HYME|nr:hypothetical protein K0M31_005974 [Melipona bicolor]